jgi:hypothetical protein
MLRLSFKVGCYGLGALLLTFAVTAIALSAVDLQIEHRFGWSMLAAFVVSFITVAVMTRRSALVDRSVPHA